MIILPEQIKRTVEFFAKLPGVGEKTAVRQTMVLAHWDAQKLQDFAQSLLSLTTLRKCDDCGLYARENDSHCEICLDGERTIASSLCVVESLSDAIAIEKSGTFKGLFHVLGGVLNPLAGIGPDELGIDQLASRIKNKSIKEIVLAVNPSVEGDATCSYIKNQIDSSVRVERIGFGIPIGGSLEYLDSLTISKALENRKTL